MEKHYDKAYFDRWYRDGGIGDRARLARKVALAVACAEYHLERPIRTVLDIGAGEAAWRLGYGTLRSRSAECLSACHNLVSKILFGLVCPVPTR